MRGRFFLSLALGMAASLCMYPSCRFGISQLISDGEDLFLILYMAAFRFQQRRWPMKGCCGAVANIYADKVFIAARLRVLTSRSYIIHTCIPHIARQICKMFQKRFRKNFKISTFRKPLRNAPDTFEV